jgi:hypothetical protein
VIGIENTRDNRRRGVAQSCMLNIKGCRHAKKCNVGTSFVERTILQFYWVEAVDTGTIKECFAGLIVLYKKLELVSIKKQSLSIQNLSIERRLAATLGQ